MKENKFLAKVLISISFSSIKEAREYIANIQVKYGLFSYAPKKTQLNAMNMNTFITTVDRSPNPPNFDDKIDEKAATEISSVNILSSEIIPKPLGDQTQIPKIKSSRTTIQSSVDKTAFSLASDKRKSTFGRNPFAFNLNNQTETATSFLWQNIHVPFTSPKVQTGDEPPEKKSCDTIFDNDINSIENSTKENLQNVWGNLQKLKIESSKKISILKNSLKNAEKKIAELGQRNEQLEEEKGKHTCLACGVLVDTVVFCSAKCHDNNYQ